MSDWGTTTKVQAIMTLANGEVYPGYIHLQDWVHFRVGPETPLEMLNRPDAWFPVTLDDGTAFLLPKSQVAMIVCDWPATGPELPPADTSVGLTVMLVTGEEFSGQVTAALPPGRRRALDFLNASQPFFLLQTESGPRLINGAHVRLAQPLD